MRHRLIALTAALIHCVLTAAQAADNRPNLLFIYTDDQRYDAFGTTLRELGERARFPWFKTPNMDRLAAEGVRFRNAFVVNSLCAPSRAVNLTGRYSHFNGVASNFRPFPPDNITHATLLRAAGYTTGYVGKWHMDSQRERPGFDWHASFIGHARYVDPPFVVQGEDKATKGWIDDISTDYAIEFLHKQKGGAKPWSLVVGFKSPHGPCEPPERAKDRFAGELARAVPNLQTPVPYLPGLALKAKSAPAADGKAPVNLNYFRCISAADDCLGRLLDALNKLGFSQNTVVIYTSDNGYYLGEHGLGDKRSAYDESLRVPFLVRYLTLGAAAKGRVVDAMVLNLDLAPSLLDFAGLPAPKEMQGRSWRPLLTGEPADWRQAWFYEYFAEKQRNSRVPDITAVRTTDAKLIKYIGHDDWTELFDLKADPYETHNLYREPAHAALRARLETEHAQLSKKVGYRVPDYVDRPDWWGKPAADASLSAPPEVRLEFTFEKDSGQRITDSSGKNNHGNARGTTTAKGRDGHAARAFDGASFIEVPKSASLNPADSPRTVEAVVKPTKPDGVILARGGKSQGYALWLKQGRPSFTVIISNRPHTVTAVEAIADWATLTGIITAQHKIALYVNGRLVGRAPLPDFIESDPHDTMQIGADQGSPVLDPVPPKFSGLIERVTLVRGERKQE